MKTLLTFMSKTQCNVTMIQWSGYQTVQAHPWSFSKNPTVPTRLI